MREIQRVRREMKDKQNPNVLPFSVIQDRLDPLVEALTNLIEREFPPALASIDGLQPFLIVAMEASKNTFEAIRYLAADVPDDPRRKPEFALVVSPLARTLADLIFTLVFMKEDLPNRVIRYHRGGWREAKEDHERHRSEYGGLQEWQASLQQGDSVLDAARERWGVPNDAVNRPTALPYWPIPSQMLGGKDLSDENRQFLTFLNNFVYRGLSSDAHVSAFGIIRQHMFLLETDQEKRRQFLSRAKSAGVFTATTLMVAICTEVNDICRYEKKVEALSYLWGVLVEYWGPAKELFERRYKGLLDKNRESRFVNG